MFFKEILRNSSKSRKNNGLFYGSLVIAIIASYTLLSVKEQDVMFFLSNYESEAVQKFIDIMWIVYFISTFFMFFLVYFACKYQIQSRLKEFGLYLMLGMKKTRLLLMLFLETLLSSVIALLIGLPASFILTEVISLATTKIVGLDIIRHNISFSLSAMLITIIGFIVIQLITMAVILLPLYKKEPFNLLNSENSEAKSVFKNKTNILLFISGVICLAVAYYLGLSGLFTYDYNILILLIFGVVGTFLIYSGLSSVIGKSLNKKSKTAKDLSIFIKRQLQENVFLQKKSLTVSSLLLMLALSCLSYGISLSFGEDDSSNEKICDFSVECSDEADDTDTAAILQNPEINEMIDIYYPVYTSGIKGGKDPDLSKLNQAIKENYKGRYDYRVRINSDIDIISISSYNSLKGSLGQKQLNLPSDSVAIYEPFQETAFINSLKYAINKTKILNIDSRDFKISEIICDGRIVCDRLVTVDTALIVPDELYSKLTYRQTPFCYNVNLKPSIIKAVGNMKATQKFSSLLDKYQLRYENYLKKTGRHLFYIVCGSYIAIYLGVIFILIANAVIGIKYLLSIRKNEKRYKTLLMLGATIESISKTVKKEISLFFLLSLSLGVLSSIFAILSLMFSTSLYRDPTAFYLCVVSGIVILAVFSVAEFIYITIVKNMACKSIKKLSLTDLG